MSIFDKKGPFHKLSVQKLRPSLIERDVAGGFSEEIFREFSKSNLFKNSFSTSPADVSVLQNYYDIARGSLDLPFTSSMAAHGYVGVHLLKAFGNVELIGRYQEAMEAGEKIAAISNSENGTSVNLKKMEACLTYKNEVNHLAFTKPCVTNGGIADLLFTSLWNKDQLEIYLLEKEEVSQTSISSELMGFRTGDTGSISGKIALVDLENRKLTSGKETMAALRYCFFIERLIVVVMAAGLAHGLEDYLFSSLPDDLIDAGKDQKQFLQEKVLKLHMVRIQMTSLVETVIKRRPEDFLSSDSELSILKIMISTELREAVFNCIELVGHKALYDNHVLPKVLRDIQMCSFFGGTQELQKINLYGSLLHSKKELKAQTLEIVESKIV